MTRPRVLVTGATGFAGSHMLDCVRAAGYPVRVMVRRTSNLRWTEGEGIERVVADVRDTESLPALLDGVGWVFHFSGLTRAANRAAYMRVNNEGTQALWTAATRHGSEMFVFFSSLAASGPAPARDCPRREDDEPQPISPYGESKLAAERWLQSQTGGRLQSQAGGPRLLILRPPTIYGPRDRMVLTLFQWARRGILPLPAPRGASFSLIHARDLAQGALGLAERGATGVFHISDGGVYTWEDIGAAAAAALGRRMHMLRIPSWIARLAGEAGQLQYHFTRKMPAINRDKVRDILQPYWICDAGRALAAGFTPRIEMPAGICETIDWYRAEGWL